MARPTSDPPRRAWSTNHLAHPRRTRCRERRREEGARGRVPPQHPAAEDQVTLVGVGAIMTEVRCGGTARSGRRARRRDLRDEPEPAVPRRCARAMTCERARVGDSRSPLPRWKVYRAPLVTVMDAHPHTLAFFAGVRGDRVRTLGVTEFRLEVSDAYRLHGIDAESINLRQRSTSSSGAAAASAAAPRSTWWTCCGRTR